jgi:hypothetical protein
MTSFRNERVPRGYRTMTVHTETLQVSETAFDKDLPDWV